MTSNPVTRDTGASYPIFTADKQKTKRSRKMIRKQKFYNLEITTYGYEGLDVYFKTFAPKIAQSLKTGDERFEYGGNVYDMLIMYEDTEGVSYEIIKYCKSDCREMDNGVWLIDTPTRIFCGTLVANVWRSK